MKPNTMSSAAGLVKVNQAPSSTQLSTQAAGTLLALLFVYVLYQISTVLSDFRDPIFYAVLCATSLRVPKTRIVARIVSASNNPDIILLFQPFVLVVFKPAELLLGVWSELKRLLATFRASLVARRRAGERRGLGSAVPVAYALADTIRSVRKRGKSSADEHGDRHVDIGDGRVGVVERKTSSTLLRVLAKLVVIQLLVRWVKSTLSSVSQVALFSIVATIGVGAVGV